MNRIERDSPLRKPPAEISERQLVMLDGIRYSADMAGIAIDRLWQKLCAIDRDTDTHPSPSGTAEAMLDAWSIIDAAHRLTDLIGNLPGLPNAPWQRIFQDRMADALALRNVWQHQLGEAPRVIAQRGQIWGALAWMQHEGPRPTGHWFLAVAGTEFKGSKWVFAGPATAIPREDSRRIRLLHGERTVYLARMVRDIFEAISHLENDIRAGALRLVGEQVDRQRESDSVFSATIIAVYGPPDADGLLELKTLPLLRLQRQKIKDSCRTQGQGRYELDAPESCPADPIAWMPHPSVILDAMVAFLSVRLTTMLFVRQHFAGGRYRVPVRATPFRRHVHSGLVRAGGLEPPQAEAQRIFLPATAFAAARTGVCGLDYPFTVPRSLGG